MWSLLITFDAYLAIKESWIQFIKLIPWWTNIYLKFHLQNRKKTYNLKIIIYQCMNIGCLRTVYALYFMKTTVNKMCVGIVISLIRTFAFCSESRLACYEDDKGSYFLFILGESMDRFVSWSHVVKGNFNAGVFLEDT